MIRCRICNREFNWITHSHLRTHGLDEAGYQEQFPNAPLMSKAFRKKRSEDRQRDWHRDPGRRKRMSEQMTQHWEDPEYKDQVSAAIKAGYRSEEVRRRTAEITRQTWQDPEVRKRRRRGLHRALQNPEYREKISHASKERWRDPEYQAKVLPVLEREQKSPERIEASRRAMKRKWKDDTDYRDKVTSAARAQWTPTKKKARSRELRHQWRDPEYRERMSNIRGQGRGKGGVLEGTDIWMRSTWERNYARILNARGKRWRYEDKRFQLSNGSTYTPDFRIGKTTYIELKGYEGKAWKTKLRRFREDHPDITLRVINEERYERLAVKWRHLPNWEESK